MLVKYFETKIGQKLTKNIVTGNRFFTEVYERTYLIEVIGVDGGKLFVQVDSYDKAPAGGKKGGTDQDFGEVVIPLYDFESRQAIISAILEKVDGEFLKKYNIKVS